MRLGQPLILVREWLDRNPIWDVFRATPTAAAGAVTRTALYTVPAARRAQVVAVFVVGAFDAAPGAADEVHVGCEVTLPGETVRRLAMGTINSNSSTRREGFQFYPQAHLPGDSIVHGVADAVGSAVAGRADVVDVWILEYD